MKKLDEVLGNETPVKQESAAAQVPADRHVEEPLRGSTQKCVATIPDANGCG